MSQLTILTADRFKELFPQITAQIELTRLRHYIEEAEYQYVKEKITDTLYIDLLDYLCSEDKSPFPNEYKTLLNGGVFTKTTCGLAEKRIFKGLYSAIAYYAYAKMIMRNEENVTRFGFTMKKDDEYSSHVELKAKLAAQSESLTIADIYLQDCITYIKVNNFPKYTKTGAFKNRMKLTVYD